MVESTIISRIKHIVAVKKWSWKKSGKSDVIKGKTKDIGEVIGILAIAGVVLFILYSVGSWTVSTISLSLLQNVNNNTSICDPTQFNSTLPESLACSSSVISNLVSLTLWIFPIIILLQIIISFMKSWTRYD